MRRLLLALLLSALVSGPAAGQEPTTGGFLFAYAPGDREMFEAGYRRHLDWHRNHGDSLSWFGWDVLVGTRPGVFVDGVFGLPFRVLDVRVDPAGDQADAATNVLPYAEPVSREMIALRADLSSATPLEAGGPTRFVEVVRWAVAPAGQSRMEVALSALRRETERRPLLPYTVYERVAGAEPGFVLMVWRDRLATFDEHDRNPQRVLRALLGDSAPADEPGDAVRTVASEVWLYRPDLTYLGEGGEER